MSADFPIVDRNHRISTASKHLVDLCHPSTWEIDSREGPNDYGFDLEVQVAPAGQGSLPCVRNSDFVLFDGRSPSRTHRADRSRGRSVFPTRLTANCPAFNRLNTTPWIAPSEAIAALPRDAASSSVSSGFCSPADLGKREAFGIAAPEVERAGAPAGQPGEL